MSTSSTPAEYADTSSFSYHVDRAFYDRLDHYRDRFGEDWPTPEPATHTQALSPHLTRTRSAPFWQPRQTGPLSPQPNTDLHLLTG